jgi:hypothetical protein
MLLVDVHAACVADAPIDDRDLAVIALADRADRLEARHGRHARTCVDELAPVLPGELEK